MRNGKRRDSGPAAFFHRFLHVFPRRGGSTLVLPFLILVAFEATMGIAFDPVPFLKGYLAIDSAQETRQAAEYLAGPLQRAGLSVRLIEAAPGQVNLIAQWPGTDPSLPPLILTHHMDTALPAWPVREARGILFGSGALDDKSLGAAHLAALLEAARIRSRRGVILLAVCGEERGGANGMGYLAGRGLIPAGAVALGEGGRGAAAADQPLFLSLAVAEKGALWLEVHKELPGGHGASVGADAALGKALRQILDCPRRLPDARFTPFVADHIRWLRRAFPHARPVPRNAEEVEGTFHYMIYTTLNATFVGTDGGNNILPTSVRATFDVRTLDAADHPAVREMLKRELPGWTQTVRLELLPVPPSDPSHPLAKRLLMAVDRAHPGLPTGPALLGGVSDLRWLRERGIPAYGFSPFFLNYYHEATVHTDREAIPVDRFLAGVALMRSVVNSLCAE